MDLECLDIATLDQGYLVGVNLIMHENIESKWVRISEVLPEQ